MYFLSRQKDNPDFLNDYLQYYCFIQFASEKTVDEAYFDLRTFLRYIKSSIQKQNIENLEELKEIKIDDLTLNDMNNIRTQDIENYIFFLRYTLNNLPKTRNRKLSSIKKFFDYLVLNNYVSFNYARNIKSAKIEKRIPKHLTLEESKKMLAKTIQSNKPYSIRNYAITCLFLNCGVRLSELINIDLTDIKLDEMTLRVTGKGNKQRIIYLNDATKEAIEKYLTIRPKLNINYNDKNALFISERKRRISKRAVQNIIEQELKLVFDEDKDGYHTHTLRHTSATLLYDINQTDIMIIKQILGHTSLKATEIYTHVSNQKLKEYMQNFTISSILEKKENEENGKH